MKKLLLSASLLLSLGVFSQTTLFEDDFEGGSTNWTNTGSGDNAWIINNVFFGGGFVTDTPNQPGAITGGPTSTYMHIMSGLGCSILGACNANFDTGSPSDQNAAMGGVSTVGMTGVTVEFWYLCAGFTGISYGNLQYSTDGGSSWITQATYSSIATWTLESQTNALWDNQADLRIRFNWINGGFGNDPAFAVDQISIVGTSGGGGSNSISTVDDVSPAMWCTGTTTSGTVNFVATGTYTAGNIYTAQISDAAGSFASPVSIGTLASTSSGALVIPSTIPGGVIAGSGYRVRVTSSAPATIGTDNGTNLTVNPVPTVSLGAYSDVCDDTPFFTLTGGTPSGGTYSGTGVAGGTFDPVAAGAGTHTITYTFTDGLGCSNSASEDIFVDACAALLELDGELVSVYPNPTAEYFVVDTKSTVEGISILDLSGRVVKTFNGAQEKYDVQNIPNGVYVLEIRGSSSTSTTRLVVR
jgi:Secretion system C-terminal sorting domain